jgi:hypothetical protein
MSSLGQLRRLEGLATSIVPVISGWMVHNQTIVCGTSRVKVTMSPLGIDSVKLKSTNVTRVRDAVLVRDCDLRRAGHGDRVRIKSGTS